MRHGTVMRTALVGGVVAALALAVPVGAITNGQPDAEEHPFVGQLFSFDPDDNDPRFDDPGGWFNCTGTLISATVVLTAGHCTFGTGDDGESTRPDGWGGNDVWVSFEEAPDYMDLSPAPFIPDDNAGRYLSYSSKLDANPTWHRGTAYPHPAFDSAAPIFADAGVVILDEPYETDMVAELPPVDFLEQFAGRAKARTVFEAVGYGLERSLPIGAFGGDTRMKSQQVIINSKGVYGIHDRSSIVFSNNNGMPHRGGTCSGDSGGPFFLDNGTHDNLLVAVNSYGVPPNCTGGDGGYRIDQPDDVEWLRLVLEGDDPRFD